MMNEHYTECRVLPAINETFPQFSARPATLQQQQQQHLPPPPPPPPSIVPHQHQLLQQQLQHQHQQQRHIPAINNLILSPLDLSLRAGVNIVPITPPSTPSPPRKRPRFMTDEQHYLWRPHAMGTSPQQHHEDTTSSIYNRSPNRTMTTEHNHHFPSMTSSYTRREEISSSSSYTMQEEGYETSPRHTFVDSNNATTMETGREGRGVGERAAMNNFPEIPKSQRSVMMMNDEDYHRQPQQLRSMATIYVDDETIVLTEDEDEDDDDDDNEDEDPEEENGIADDDEDDAMDAVDSGELDEENETLVSSQGLNEEDVESNEAHHPHQPRHTASSSSHSPQDSRSYPRHSSEDHQHENNTKQEEEDDEEYVDILSNDDDDINPLSSKAITMLRLQSQADLEQELAKSGKVLTRNKLVYENEELHNRAVDGLAKLFDRDFQENSTNDSVVNNGKTYIDLTNCPKSGENPYVTGTQAKQEIMITSSHVPSTATSGSHPVHRPPYKTHKTERKRMKLRKHMSLDEETISPVSGTIIRKLRDDEELVVRKGDIDPAFNVVEVTEEAKAILASIDNKIGAYLCQLCRTLYDDAFKLAQHRCPRIVHIEYKCSECEKVFNCPANLASHRRWHKPKSELLANSQAKKRQHAERLPTAARHSPDKNVTDDGIDGIFPCTQCGKTFRRQAYLKKHQASHQMLENLKSLDIFKNSASNSVPLHPPSGHHVNPSLHAPNRIPTNPLYHPPMIQPRPYASTRFGTFPFGTPFDHRRFYTLGEFYLSQQLERSSAFQYVQANHLRNLSNVAAGNFANRPVVPSPLIPLPVK